MSRYIGKKRTNKTVYIRKQMKRDVNEFFSSDINRLSKRLPCLMQVQFLSLFRSLFQHTLLTHEHKAYDHRLNTKKNTA